jgi:hypothetical protein
MCASDAIALDEGAVRNTRDVDLLVRRGDFNAVRAALESVGFLHHTLLDVETFIDGASGRPSDGIHLIFAGEKVKPEDPVPAPTLDRSQRAAEFQVADLTALVQMKLTAWRLKDQVHLLDLINVGMIDASFPAQFPQPLRDRLQHLLDNPKS